MNNVFKNDGLIEHSSEGIADENGRPRMYFKLLKNVW